MKRTTSCCSGSSDADNDDSAVKSAGSARPTNISQRIPLCIEPITTRDRVMRMEEGVRTLSKQNDASSSRENLEFLSNSPFPFSLLIFAGEYFSWEARLVNRQNLAKLRFLPRQAQYRTAPLNSHDARIDIFQKRHMIT